MNLFYTADIRTNSFTLHGQEARHCGQVLRKKPGDLIVATDGLGLRLDGEIASISKESIEVELQNKTFETPMYNDVHLVIGLLKDASRMEWLIEKVTEIGVASIRPIICQRSERSRVKFDRLHKRMISAAKQSHKFSFPILHEIDQYKTFMEDLELPGYVASYDPGNKNLWNHNYPEGSCVMLIGPEGDFTQGELQLAIDKGLQSVNLGNYRLRTETAGVVAITILQHQ